ncbi:RNA-binding domain-containing protein [Gonapodya prolifera JEL478]|uniref:RNA-binding domain-containing protein n=1 Tax=Gonapodya prolifera (strain JEL478) TaxID=1344416 RepID=A0A139ARG4_GONPJ|nr:RNA-binding domain-containing protein [Gonapodya prolifera JEL478]|eukprot:KXS19085.1 RNA-binding domain-containing protein [Gonapodya prolifera JEL478]
MATSAAVPLVTAAVPPNQTLYVSNLNDKINKEVLRRTLFHLFSPYGRVLDVVALKTGKMRGQAHVVLEGIPQATGAMRGLQGFILFEKGIKISYAKTTSNAVSLVEGKYIPPPSLDSKDGTGAKKKKVKRSRDDDSDDNSDEEEDGRKRRKEDEADGEEDMETDEPSRAAPAAPASSTPAAPSHPSGPVSLLPNRVLFISNLPPEITDEMLGFLFQQYAGYREVRLVPGKTDIAFVEYDTEGQAATAKTVLDGFLLTPTTKMKVEFAKRA